MRRHKNKLWLAILMSFLLVLPIQALADVAVGDTIVTLGENLTPAQKTELLKEMEVADNVEMITVSNAEEHEYLGSYISSRLIGTKALSSSVKL